MSKVIEIRIPAPDGAPFSDGDADTFKGQYAHVLFAGHAYLARVETVSLCDEGASVYLACAQETPEEEPVPEPLELALQSDPVNTVEDGITYPCLPIACDADVRHLPGCVFAQEDGTPHFPAGESDG